MKKRNELCLLCGRTFTEVPPESPRAEWGGRSGPESKRAGNGADRDTVGQRGVELGWLLHRGRDVGGEGPMQIFTPPIRAEKLKTWETEKLTS